MISAIALLLLCCLLWYCITAVQRRLSSKTTSSVSWPHVRGRLPGNIDVLWRIGKTAPRSLPGEAFAQLAKIYGATFDLKPLGSSMVYTQDPEFIRHVLSVSPQNYAKGKFLNDLFQDVLGTGIFNSDGEAWKGHRASARPFFLKESLKDFSVYAKHTDRLVAAIKSATEPRAVYADNAVTAVEFHQFAQRFTLDAASDFLFGHNIDSMAGLSDVIQDPPYLSAFTRVQGRLARRLQAGKFWRFFESNGEMASDMRTINEVVDSAIRRATLCTREPHNADTDSHKTLLHLLEQSSFREYKAEEKRDELLNVMMAARDTTASLITSVMYELSRNLTIQSELRSEVRALLGEEMLSFEFVKDLKLLRAIINETLRLYPPISANSRVAIKDDVVDLNGQRSFVSAGTHIAWGVFQLQRRPDLWGDDAHVWRPNRWLEGSAIPATSPAAFQAWGAGPRICIGQELAYLQVSYLLCQLLREFEGFSFAADRQPEGSWIPGHEGQDIMPQAPVVTLSLRGGLWLRFITAGC